MEPLVAHVIHSGQRVQLPPSNCADTPTVVPSAYIVIELDGVALPAFVELDGRLSPLVTNDTRTKGYLQVDVFRSVGFHKLEVWGQQFVFATEDAKLRLDGILKILDYIGTAGLSWGSQLYFSDGAALRHPKIDYAWLSVAGPEIVQTAEYVAVRPYRKVEMVPRVQRPQSGRLMLHQTIKLLRSNPRTLLEEHRDGPIVVGDHSYMPRIAVIRKALSSFNNVGNRRLTWLLRECAQLAANIRDLLPSNRRQEMKQLERSCQNALERFPFSQLSNLPLKLPETPAPEEVIDERYQKSFRFYEELIGGIGWRPGLKMTSRFAFVAYSDEIYQAFVAMTIARAFGLQQVHSYLSPSLDVPMFKSCEYELYYDTTPPTRYLSNWREVSSRPTAMRPDLTLVHLPSRCGMILDAKYRVGSGGRAPNSALNECQVYMQGFGRNVIGMCYPGDRLEMNAVSGDGKTILEIAISPIDGLNEYLVSVVRPCIEALLEPLNAQ
jgi:hypothetical protein